VIPFGLLVTALFWVALWCIGEATADVLFGRRAGLIASVTRLPLGLATTLCLLETSGYFLPIRWAVWLLVPFATYGAWRIARAFRRVCARDRAIITVSACALAVGLAPVAIAGRFTAAALTNNDATYYITAADWLARVPWRMEYAAWPLVPPAQCMIERVLHQWNWRTGIPNLMAAVSSLSGLGSTQTLAVATAILFACVPCAAIGIGRALGVRRSGFSELLVGIVPALAAAPAFLGYQHMTGHLGAQSLFLAASSATLGGVRHGGFRRLLYAALLFGASVAMFADGALMLVAIAGAAVAANHRNIVRALGRAAVAAIATCVVAPFTVGRAARAAWNTVFIRLPSPRVVFPQRGWLPRGLLDDLATLTGVDPWPPWPAAWPPNLQTGVTWIGALCGAVLFGYGAAKLRPRRAERQFATLVAVAVLGGVALITVRYLKGKLLLTGATFVVPLCAIGATELIARGHAGWLAVPFVVAELFALRELVRPSHWKVVDRPAHDALVPELARVPAGSIIAFDGLGAPADVVLDAHRAHRAALLADLRPMQPGLDGGFYGPLCEDIERPDPLPPRAYALQRVTSETLTRGNVIGNWGDFRLLEVDLTNRNAFIAAWAPTHGWMAAEHDPDGRVFRWAEWQSHGTLHVVAPAPCATMRGEMRVVQSSALVSMKSGDYALFDGIVTAEWTVFETGTFDIRTPLELSFVVAQAAAPPPDPGHALALSRLVLEPSSQCGNEITLGDSTDPVTLPIDFEDEVELSIVSRSPAPCSQISMVLASQRPASVSISVDRGPPTFRYMNAKVETFDVVLPESARQHRITILRKGGEPGSSFRLVDATVTPRNCAR
jgi:hypothetical protein